MQNSCDKNCNGVIRLSVVTFNRELASVTVSSIRFFSRLTSMLLDGVLQGVRTTERKIGAKNNDSMAVRMHTLSLSTVDAL